MLMRFGTVNLQETLRGKYCLSTYPKFTCTSKPNSIIFLKCGSLFKILWLTVNTDAH
jgi:hypothetical protein